MKKQIIQNAIKTPNGTILVSNHTHDFQSYVDPTNGEYYMVDGGLDYLKRSGANYTELAVYEDDSFEELRLKYMRGGRGKDGIEAVKYTPISEMSDEWLLNAIKYNSDRGIPNCLANKMYSKELAYRQIKQLEPMKNRQFKNPKTGSIFTKISETEYQFEEGKTLSAWYVEENFNEIFSLDVLIGTNFKSKDSETIYTLLSENNGRVVVSWGDNEGTSTSCTIQDVNKAFKDKAWNIFEVPKLPLFVTDDGVEMFEGDTWFYVNLSKLKYAPKKTGNFEYKGNKPAEILTFSTKEVANEYLLRNRTLFSLRDIANNIGHLDGMVEIARKRF